MAKLSGQLEVTESEINVTLLALQAQKQSQWVRNVIWIRTHPDAKTFSEISAPTSYDGPSTNDLLFDTRMDLLLEKNYHLPMGSLTSLVFPLDQEKQIPYFFKTNRFQSGPQS